MSRRSEIQAISMLCAIAGCFSQLHTFRYFGRVDMHKLCGEYYDITINMIADWPGDPTDLSIPETVNVLFKQWETIMGKEAEGLSAATLVFICSQVLADLQDKTNSRWKRLQLQKLDKAVESLEAFVDPTVSNFPAYDQAKRLIGILYKLIGWEFRTWKVKYV